MDRNSSGNINSGYACGICGTALGYRAGVITGRSMRPHEVVAASLVLLLLQLLAWNAVAVQPMKAKPPPVALPPPQAFRQSLAPRLPPPPLRPAAPRAVTGKLPNFVVIVTDDQDEVLNSTHAAYMPALNSLVGSRGTRFANTLVSTSVCCPARVSILTGRLAHCTNVTANWAPMGAWNKFIRQEIDLDWLPGWLHQAGYHTALVGKLLNGFSVPLSAQGRCPLGIDYLDALTEGTYSFYNSSFSRSCAPSQNLQGLYQTDVIRDKALAYIDSVVSSGVPFYLQLTPAAPHVDNGGQGWRPPPPALRHEGLYPNLGLPDNPTFTKVNPLNPSRRLDMTIPENVRAMTDLYVGRLRSLRAVDEMLEAIVEKLSDLGILNNTYIMYMSDNGLHMGQHGLDDGKATPLEEDSRVPLYLTGPGVPAGVVSNYQSNLIDIAPTILALAGLEPRPDLDGLPLPIEGLTTDAYRKAMQQAATAAARRANLLPLSPPPPPSPPKPSPSPPPPPRTPRAPRAPKAPRVLERLLARRAVVNTSQPVLPPPPPLPSPFPLHHTPLSVAPGSLQPVTPSPLSPYSPPVPHSPFQSPVLLPSPQPSPIPPGVPRLPSVVQLSPLQYPSPERGPSPPPYPPTLPPPPPVPSPAPQHTRPSLLVARPPPPQSLGQQTPPSPLDGSAAPPTSLPSPSPSPLPPFSSSPSPSLSRPPPKGPLQSSAPPPSPPELIWLREAVILEAWDSDAKSGVFPGITFKALRLCSTYQPNLTAPAPSPPMGSTGQSRRPPPSSPPPPRRTGGRGLSAVMVPQPGTGVPPLFCLKYVVWCKDNQRELYDLSNDPYEATDILSFAPTALLKRLDAVLSVLVHCSGGDCAHPYGVLHPAGDVLTFAQAMDPRQDTLYANLPRFAFVTCYPGYVPPNERTFTLGIQGFPANVSWNSTGIVWPLPPGVKGIKMEPGE